VGTDNGLAAIGREKEARGSKHETAPDPPDTSRGDSAKAFVPLSSKNRMKGWRINNLKVLHNYLYVATDRGVLRRPLGSYGDFQFVNTPDGLLSTEIIDIARSGDSLFFALKDEIVIVDTATGNTGMITAPSFQGQRVIREIVVDGQNLWAATSLGLWKYRLDDGYYRLFTIGDGMISGDIRGLELVGGHIWLATPKGAIRFYWNNPDRID
jgi:ligand-binding sensor domain-containing protein